MGEGQRGEMMRYYNELWLKLPICLYFCHLLWLPGSVFVVLAVYVRITCTDSFCGSKISIGDARPSTVIAFPSLPLSTKEKGLDLTRVELLEFWNGFVDSSVTYERIQELKTQINIFFKDI